MPAGVILSPPESAQNSSDDDESANPRGRQIAKLSELQAAIRNIAQNRASSPNDENSGSYDVDPALNLIVPKQTDHYKDALDKSEHKSPISATKISHTRSKTDTALYTNRQLRADTPITDSDDDSESGWPRRKPPMVRKKSGELVRPALRASSRRRPSSMPGTPTFSKAVHFDAHLEHVRHFLQVDRPLAVSGGSSPVDTHASDSDFPFSDDDNQSRIPPFEWEINLANFPADSYERRQLPVRLERVYLSSDNKTLIGSVAVANLSFHKTVVARFTLDYWKTTSEVVAEYTNDVRQKPRNDGYDRFNFTIKLADLANLETKTLFFCIKYCVNGVEYWDNNNSTNFQVDFKKKMKPINGKKGRQGASSRQATGLPRSNNKQLPSNRQDSSTFDDFSDGFDSSSKYRYPYSAPSDNYLGGNGRLKGVKSAVTLSTDNPTKKLSSPSGQAFSNRYDFGVSISAAIKAANNTSSDRTRAMQKSASERQHSKTQTSTLAPSSSVSATPDRPSGTNPPKPIGAGQPPLASQSYNELLDKYCFFGSAKSSPPLQYGSSTSHLDQHEGTHSGGDCAVDSDSSSPGSGSPLMMQTAQRPASAGWNSSGNTQRPTSPAPMTGFMTAIRG